LSGSQLRRYPFIAVKVKLWESPGKAGGLLIRN
jgi:hypothetical protein